MITELLTLRRNAKNYFNKLGVTSWSNDYTFSYTGDELLESINDDPYGFGITDKNIKSLKSANGLVVGSLLCKIITNSVQKRQNPVTNLNKMIYKLKKEIS